MFMNITLENTHLIFSYFEISLMSDKNQNYIIANLCKQKIPISYI